METPIDKILEQENAASSFDQGPGQVPMMQMPMSGLQVPSGPSQGKSSAFLRESFSNFQKTDYITVILVFILLFIALSGIASVPFRSVPLLYQDNRLTNTGAIIVAIIGSLIYLLVKVFTVRN